MPCDVAFSTYDVIFSPKRRLFGSFDKKWVSVHLFKVVFRLNCHIKSCFPWCVEYFEKLFLACDVLFSTYDVILAQKDVFWQFLTKMSILHPLKFRLNCQRKSYFLLMCSILQRAKKYAQTKYIQNKANKCQLISSAHYLCIWPYTW